MSRFNIFLLSIWVLFTCCSLQAAPKTAKNIMLNIENKNSGYESEQSYVRLVLYDSSGTKIQRKLKLWSYEKSKNLEYFLLEFLKPSDVKGTKLLTWAHRNKTDDQWIYLSSVKRPKRILGSNRSASFMGSEFTYEDFTGSFVNKFTYKLLNEKKTDNGLIWVIQRTPKEDMSYAKQKIFISKKFMNVVKTQYFNAAGKKYKVAKFKNFKKYIVDGREMYRSQFVKMENLINKRKSLMIWDEQNLGGNVKSHLFRKSSLR